MPVPKYHQRRFHTNSKKHKKVPETAEDFLEAGIEFEESGDRWKAGDRQKAARFYRRAIEQYEQCLKIDSTQFDAAYNKARLEYKLTQEPEMCTKLELLPLLETALKSHMEVLGIERENLDAIFNTAQVHTSLAEQLTDLEKPRAVSLLNTACQLFQEVLSKQRAKFASYSSVDAIDTEAGGVSLAGVDDMVIDDDAETSAQTPSSTKDETDDNEEYAHIEVPVTESTILDTHLEFLATLCTLLPLNPSPSLLQTTSDILTSTQSFSTSLPDRAKEITLTSYQVHLAAAECQFRLGMHTAADWAATISKAFPTDLKTAEAYSIKSDAHIALASEVSEMAFAHLSFASAALKEASKIQQTAGNVYLAWGDVELMRSRVAPEAHRITLKKNAGVYYRAAMKLGDATEKFEAMTKEAFLKWGEGGGTELLRSKAAQEVIAEAVEEGVIERDEAVCLAGVLRAQKEGIMAEV